MSLRPISPIEWTAEGTLRLLDQRLLPNKEVWVECPDFPSVLSAIREMLIRGAPALGIAAAMGLALGARGLPDSSYQAFLAGFASLSQAMGGTRPTARNLFWAIDRMARVVRESRELAVPQIKERLIREALAIAEEDVRVNRALSEFGKALLPRGARILTHCNAGALATGGHGTALGVIRSAFAEGNQILVYVDETRPYLQGSRLTAWELVEDQIPMVLITDSMAGYFMARGEIDLVLVGADRIAANGDTANKIGTYSLAILSWAHRIPFYVAAPLSTFDPTQRSGQQIPIEYRGEEEVKCFQGFPVAPAQARAANPAFDITPGAYINCFITEVGILHPPYEESKERALRGPRRSAKEDGIPG
ncbi:MAG: S-methyl-5-thioribose-1-phosphate isomerase, partial [candidate division NC10 bacterium]|nr:S-methyl-5-thioribose-1-phosphate isomerase [candidate division NC10 bacterium]